jgi:hypothetical protein
MLSQCRPLRGRRARRGPSLSTRFYSRPQSSSRISRDWSRRAPASRGRSVRAWRPSSRRSPDHSITKSAGVLPSCCISKASSSGTKTPGRTAAIAVEGGFQRSLDWARRQGAPSWELRAATSLARLWQTQGRARDARAVLTPVYRRFTEGFGTSDLASAKTLLQALPQHGVGATARSMTFCNSRMLPARS